MQTYELRDLRKRAGLKQAELARLIGVTAEYVSMLERGAKPVPPKTEAALREALQGAVGEQGEFVPTGAFLREAQQAVVSALQAHPDLTLNGFRYHAFDKDRFEAFKREHESRSDLFSDDSLSQVATALGWISSCKLTNELKIGSYGAKHRAEGWGREHGLASYVANGALLAAAIHRRVPLKRIGESPNAVLGLDPDPLPEVAPDSFVGWLRTQTKRRGAMGDFVRDAVADRDFPIDTTSGARLRSYMWSQRACPEAVAALETALKEWRASRSASRVSASTPSAVTPQ